MANQAAFTIDGTPSADPTTGDRQFTATHGQTLTVRLEVNPSLALSAVFEVFDPADLESPFASKAAPLLTWTENSLPAITLGTIPFGINDPITIDMPAAVVLPAVNIHSYVIRCTVATPGDGSPESQTQVFERMVLIFSLVNTPNVRKTVPGETTQARARAWSDSINDLVDAVENNASLISGGLQSTYILGNTIDVTLAGGPLQFNSTVAVTQSPLTVRMDAVPVIEVDIAGAINLDPTSGENFDLTTAGGGTVNILSDGDFDIVSLSPSGAAIQITAALADMDIAAPLGVLAIDGATVDMTALTGAVTIVGSSVIVNAHTFPALLVDTFSWANVNGDPGSVAPDVAGDGVITFAAPALITGYMVGLHVQNNVGTPLDKIDVAVGRARDSTDTYDITLASILSPSLTFVGANGLDTGTRQNSSLYAVYVIDDSSSPGSATLFSLNQTTPALPGSFDKFRRVASVQTNSVGNLDTFFQSEDEGSGRWMFRLKASALQVNGTATSFTNTSSVATLFAPPSASHYSLDLQAEKNTTSDLQARIEAVPDGWNETGGQYWTSYCGLNTTDQVKASSVMEIPTGPNGLIRYRVFNARATIFFRAYKDQM